jgi:hypothetical protein
LLCLTVVHIMQLSSGKIRDVSIQIVPLVGKVWDVVISRTSAFKSVTAGIYVHYELPF